jgi:hypothetical protein
MSLVARLRNYIPGENNDEVPDRIREAADRIEELEAVLRKAEAFLQYYFVHSYMQKQIRAALAEDKP